MTRLWVDGVSIQVTVSTEEEPLCFVWRERRHTINEIVNDWLIDIEWWRHRIWRHYFKLTTDTGLLVIVFHDLVTDTWYLQRLYD